jgi:ABC-2 type transport system permease protein
MTISMLLLALYNEVRIGLFMSLYYRFNTLLRLVGMMLKFIGYIFMLFQGSLLASEMVSPILGYIVYFYSFFLLLEMSWTLSSEMKEGTIEQLFMSPMPPIIVFMGRILANMIVTTIKLVLVLSLLIAYFHIPLTFNATGLFMLCLTLASLSGLGLIVAGLTLVYKRTDSLGVFFVNIFLFLGGTIIPIDKLPSSIQLFAMTFPTTQGIIMLRNTVIHKESLYTTISNGGLITLLITTAIYLGGGIYIFSLCVNHVKKQGSLGQY